MGSNPTPSATLLPYLHEEQGEQGFICNLWIRKIYRPIAGASPSGRGSPSDDLWLEAARAGTLTADELLQACCARVFMLTGSYRATACKLGLDWRTIQRHLDGSPIGGKGV